MRNPQLASRFYLKDTAGAPLIEDSREAFENPKVELHGRVYWNTDLAIYHGPKYDAAAFSLWFDKVVRWIRKNGRIVQVTKNWKQYWLPGAWELRSGSAMRDS